MIYFLSLLLVIFSFTRAAEAATEQPAKKLLVVTTTTDLAWAAREIFGDAVEVRSLLKGNEDPHFVDVRPDFISHVGKADVVCAVGLDLEIGWLPKVLSKAGRGDLQPGGKGFCDFGSRIEALEKPAQPLDRSHGHVHSRGNPHYWLSPSLFAKASREVLDAVERVQPGLKKRFEERFSDYERTMMSLESRMLSRLKAANIQGQKARFAAYHSEFSYFAKSFGLVLHNTIEEKPGLLPSAGRLAKVADGLKADNVSIVLAARFASPRTIRKFEELSGLSVGVVPVSVIPNSVEGANNYQKLIENIVETVISVSEKNLGKQR
jgi:zinc/manganese transport system substrate-binding protein